MANILEVKDLTKVYPGGILANYNINFSIKEGEIHALVGENGSGKTTLMKMLFGIEEITNGEIYYKGKKVAFESSKDAIKLGIGMVHQHFMLVPSLTVAENLTLGIEKKKGVFIDMKSCISAAEDISSKYNLRIDQYKRVRDISVSMKQKLEILKALYRGAELLILDEPTAVLTPQETEELFEQLLNLKKLGHTIIFISHKLDEIKHLCDRLTILKSGKCMGTYDVDELSQEEISKLMVGRDVVLNYNKEDTNPTKNVLEIKNLTYTDKFGIKKLNNISFNLKNSEVLGIAGIEGNGQNEIVSIITGLLDADSGTVIFTDQDITKIDIGKRRKLGISHVPEDRMMHGCAEGLSVSDNLISNVYKQFTNKINLLDFNEINEYSLKLIKKYDIKCSSPKQAIKGLSGGNIQKAIVAREFSVDTEVIIINQPTRGVDVGAMEFINDKILNMRNLGKSILLVSANLTELLGLSDRIIVLNKGKIVGQIKDLKNVTEEELGLYMLGLKKDSEDQLKEA
ncbi:MAG: ABC transporter ATP-binding protein [Clostridia bacterium BRH_c25]|nr:MAG: ABC transporter ATP-binding protein [Clostridia bacterium BRH_c25]